jgi:ABC-type branched-subunit amino acid transport system ATPase component
VRLISYRVAGLPAHDEAGPWLFAEGRMTVLLVEHDMEVVFRLAQRITVLHRGAVIADGLPEAIEQDERVQGAYLGGFA